MNLETTTETVKDLTNDQIIEVIEHLVMELFVAMINGSEENAETRARFDLLDAEAQARKIGPYAEGE